MPASSRVRLWLQACGRALQRVGWRWWPVGTGAHDLSRRRPVTPPAALPQPIYRCVSVVIPALNEAARIAQVVQFALADPATAEVVVVDDASIDDTAQLAQAAGARVIRSTLLGKGASMLDGVREARGEWIVFLDGDLSGLAPELITKMAGPLVHAHADFVKARFNRASGRVTELTAKPMLRVFFPELADVAQPLGGIVAASKALLLAQVFEDGYGVDVGLLIDVHRSGARVLEVDIGSLDHDSQALGDLALMANEVSRVIFTRAKAAGRLHVEQISAMFEAQRQAAALLPYVLLRRRSRTHVVLLDMDEAVAERPFLLAWAEAAGLAPSEQGAAARLTGADAAQHWARALKFRHRQHIDACARTLPLRPGVVEWVRELKRQGCWVGLVSQHFLLPTEIIRKRVFADFAVANLLQFEADVCTGQVVLNPGFFAPDASADAHWDMAHVLHQLRHDATAPRVQQIWAIGGAGTPGAFMHAADRGVVLMPQHVGLSLNGSVLQVPGFEALGALLPEWLGEPQKMG